MTALIGVDFSSRPSRRKPIMVAVGERQGAVVRLVRLQPFEALPDNAAYAEPASVEASTGYRTFCGT